MENYKDLEEFIEFTIGQSEVSLVILNANSEKADISELLKRKEFLEAKDIFDLMEKISETGKYFLFITDENCKNVYDFACQYPMGRVEIFNSEKMEAVIKNPIHKNLSVIFVSDKGIIDNCQKKGLDILAKVGLTYQVD